MVSAAAAERRTATAIDWRNALGPFWQWQLAVFAVLLFIAGFSLPFSDPDLAIHLATGEWIAKHHAVPFIEPFAWTRPGAPFQAYSWAIETLYFVLIEHFGPVGLNVLQGFVFILFGGVMFVLGRAARWKPWPTILMAFGNLVVALGATPYVRPQAVLLIVIPLIWALVYWSLDTERLGATLLGLVLSSAVLANTHLLFPLSAAPCVLLLTKMPADRRRILLVPLAIAAGWFVSPYALHWHEVFALNFAPNAIFGPPTPINEYNPGFVIMLTSGIGSLAFSLLLAALPWATANRLTALERALYGVMWLGGLVLFAVAVRSLVVWWLVVFPLCDVALGQFRPPTIPSVLTAQRAIVYAILGLITIRALETWQDPTMLSGDLSSRFLPSTNAQSIEPLAKWLDCNVRHDVGGRLVTNFNYGGYVPWRLPYLSESIDGRVIFADSVSRPEAYFTLNRRTFPLQPWATADLAIFPVSYPVAAVLDTASGWHRVAMTSTLEGKVRMIGLWVRDTWWEKAGNGPRPKSPVAALHVKEPRRATCQEIVN